MNSPEYRSDIQGLRGIAVILVVLFHAETGLSGGFVGVDVFFVISGFVITRLILRELESADSFNFRNFYVRRSRRLFPALALTTCVVAVLGPWFGPVGSQSVSAKTGLAAVLANSNHYLWLQDSGGYFDSSTDKNLFLHMWSLSLEEQFYLVFPLAMVLLWKLVRRLPSIGQSRRALVGILVAFTMGSLIFCELVLPTGSNSGNFLQRAAFYTVPTRAWEFLVGALCAIVVLRRSPRTSQTAKVIAPLSVGMIAFAALTFDAGTRFPGVSAGVPVLATALVILAGTVSPGSVVPASLSWGPLQRIGDRSYGWYLWHWPLLVMAKATFGSGWFPSVVGVLVSFVAADLSYRFIETPMRTPGVMTRRTVRVAFLVCLVTPLVLLRLQPWMSDRASERLSDQVSSYHIDHVNGCDSETPLDERAPEECLFASENPGRKVILVGDSNAGQLSEGLLVAAREVRASLQIVTLSGCPFADVHLRVNGVDRVKCRGWRDGTLEALEASPPDVMVVSFALDYYANDPKYEVSDDPRGRPVGDADEKLRVLVEGVQRAVKSLVNTDSEVIFILPTPKLGRDDDVWKSQDLSTMGLRFFSHYLDMEASLAEVNPSRAAISSAMRATGETGGFSVMDLSKSICSTDQCHAHQNGQWVFRDSGHISVHESQRLGPELAELLSSVLDR